MSEGLVIGSALMDRGSLAQLVIFVSLACCELTTRRAVALNILSAHLHRHYFFQPSVSSATKYVYVSRTFRFGGGNTSTEKRVAAFSPPPRFGCWYVASLSLLLVVLPSSPIPLPPPLLFGSTCLHSLVSGGGALLLLLWAGAFFFLEKDT